MVQAGGDGMTNDIGIIVNVEISKELVRVERWCFQRRGGKVGRSERRSDRYCALRAISMRKSVWLSQGRRKHRTISMGDTEQGRARTGRDVEEEPFVQRQLTSSKTRLIQCYGNTRALYKPT